MPDSDPPFQHHEIDPATIPTPRRGDGTPVSVNGMKTAFDGPENDASSEMTPTTQEPTSSKELTTGWSLLNRWVVAVCWFLVLGFIVFSLATPYVARQNTGEVQVQPLGMSDQIEAVYFLGMKYFPGMQESQVQELYEEAASESTGTFYQRLGDVIIAGELVGIEEAEKKLDSLQQQVQDSNYEPTQQEVQTEQALRRLYRDYADQAWDGPSLSSEQRQAITESLGWLGQLALEPKERQTPKRQQIETGAKNFAMFLVFALLLGVAAFGLGAVVGFVAVVMASMGYLRSSLKPQTGHGHIYIETFVVWLAGFIGISFVIGFLVPPAYSLMANAVGFPASLVALAWPLLRGVSFNDLCGELGITLRKLWLEPFAGLLGYIAGFPLLVLSAVFMILLMGIFGEQPSVDNFEPVYEPSHPINDTVSKGGVGVIFWVALMTCVMAPLVEETIFRGVLYRHLRDMTARGRILLSTVVSAAVSGFVFAAVHPQGIFVVPVLGTLGFIFAVVREWRGSLVAPMVMHAIHNSMITVMLVILMTMTSS